jgi:hypothetical protein
VGACEDPYPGAKAWDMNGTVRHIFTNICRLCIPDPFC